jgi:thiosulfate/3-mercaptopyruvate sulfurtransferase
MTDILVEADWLASRLKTPSLMVIDCTWHLPETGRNGKNDFIAGHIPGAQFFDLKQGSDQESPYSNMMPRPQQFAEVVGELGIDNDTHVIVYDSLYISARVWLMFRAFGHEKVSVLNGGLRRWKAEGRPLEQGETQKPVARSFTAREPSKIIDWQRVRGNIDSKASEVVDARTAQRFTGEMSSGYPGVPGGHIPGSKNVPWNKLLNPDPDFRFITPEKARRLFDDAGIDLDRPFISTCGSGVTASMLILLLEQMGKHDWSLYDGSWHEWAQLPETPKVLWNK